jgi:DNA-binding NtrC family response regulator
MKKLSCLIVADPSDAATSQIVAETTRLAENRIVARTGDDALVRIATEKPEMLLLSLEIMRPDAAAVVAKIRKTNPNLYIVATFRELGVPAMNKLAKTGVDDFVPQPIDFTALYRAASTRFGMAFRRHTRYPAALEVYRADGVLVGKTLDISEGGLRMDCIHPAQKEASMLFDIALPRDEDRRLRIRGLILDVAGEAPQKVTARLQFQNLRGEEHRRLITFLADLAKTMPDLDD